MVITNCCEPKPNLINDSLLHGFQKFIRNNLDFLRNHKEIKAKNIDLDALLEMKSVKDFDREFQTKLQGFKSVEDFYASASCKDQIKDIAIPTLFIHSLDDPVCIQECIPFEDIKSNENCMMILT
jgi:predicted alpha/beta-fold hydrolase